MKKILIAIIIIVTFFGFVLFYLNRTIVPTRIRSAIIEGLSEATHKKVVLGSVELNIFHGLILKDLIISDGPNAMVNVKEAYCAFELAPLLSKYLIISRLTLESPDIFVERRKDNSINIIELFPEDSGTTSGPWLKVLVRRVIVRRATVNFHDLTVEPLYVKEIKGLNAEAEFLFPDKIKFDTQFDIPHTTPMNIKSSGEYLLASKTLTVEVRAKDFTPAEFARYYEKAGLYFPAGKINFTINLKHKEGVLNIEAESEAKGLEISRDALSVVLDGTTRANVRYDFASKKLDYTGDANIEDMSISGVEYIDQIDDVKGRVEFSNLGIASDNITAVVLGMPIEAKVNVNDVNNPVIAIDVSSDVKLTSFQEMLKDDFSLELPADFSGDAKLKVSLQYPISAPDKIQMNGSLYMLGASAKINSGRDVLQGLTGLFSFLPNQVSWDAVAFRYHSINYNSSGILTDFTSPGIQLKLSSKDISMEAIFALNGKAVNFSKFHGKYLNSAVSAAGSLDASDPSKLIADMKGSLNVDVEDLKRPLEKFKDKFERIKPKGIVRAEFSLNGDLKNLKNCAMTANLSSDELSLYGFKLATTTMNYSQKDGAGDILFMRSFLYGGSLSATGRIDWASKGVPYNFNVDIEGVKLEKFKIDTAFKDKDIAGSVKVHAKIKGLFGDAGRLAGEGALAITEGKIWQLNLFRGMGALLFTSDFSNIIFKEGRCDFTIADKAIYADELTLTSDLVKIYGPIKIGFDNTVDATFKAEFSDDAMSPGAKQNIALAIGKYSLIKVTGTLKDPAYKMTPDVENIMVDVAETWFSQ